MLVVVLCRMQMRGQARLDLAMAQTCSRFFFGRQERCFSGTSWVAEQGLRSKSDADETSRTSCQHEAIIAVSE